MKRQRTIWNLALLSLVCGLSLTACSSHRALNNPGERIEVRDHLVAGKTNIFYFYADW